MIGERKDQERGSERVEKDKDAVREFCVKVTGGVASRPNSVRASPTMKTFRRLE